MIRDLQRVLEPSYVGGLADAPIEQIRAMRAECTELENGASFVRRLAQGRLDLLGGRPARVVAVVEVELPVEDELGSDRFNEIRRHFCTG